MHEQALGRLVVVAELRDAVAGNELELFYQPVVEAGSGRLAGAEALLRWHHRTRGLLLPLEFLPLAETSGLVVALGRWVLSQACCQAQQWLKSGQVQDGFFYGGQRVPAA